VRTSVDAKISTESDPGFESRFWINPYPDVRRMCVSQNVVNALSCRRQSFRQVWYKSAVDCMRNANKCQKIPYTAMLM